MHTARGFKRPSGEPGREIVGEWFGFISRLQLSEGLGAGCYAAPCANLPKVALILQCGSIPIEKNMAITCHFNAKKPPNRNPRDAAPIKPFIPTMIPLHAYNGVRPVLFTFVEWIQSLALLESGCVGLDEISLSNATESCVLWRF